MIGSAVIQLAGDRSSISRQYPNGGGGRSLTYHCRLPSADISTGSRCRWATFTLYSFCCNKSNAILKSLFLSVCLFEKYNSKENYSVWPTVNKKVAEHQSLETLLVIKITKHISLKFYLQCSGKQLLLRINKSSWSNFNLCLCGLLNMDQKNVCKKGFTSIKSWHEIHMKHAFAFVVEGSN